MSFSVKGWCPGAYRPMLSGDGLVVRVRPRLARLDRVQALGLCAAATRHGAGLIDLTNRANLQIRGVSEGAWPALIDDLGALGLLDDDPATEGRRNIIVAPFWVPGDDTHRLTLDVLARLGDLPALPAKVGFAVDVGAAPVLRGVSADFRFERGISGRVILRAEGHEAGVPLAPGAEVSALIRLAAWFVTSGGAAAGRMARHDVALPDWALGTEAPVVSPPRLHPGAHLLGAVRGLPFGQIRAADLAAAITESNCLALRLTPWRMLILEGGAEGAYPGLLAQADAAELRADACPGAPFCPQASIETRDLARDLARHFTGSVHVSGCAKGCARQTKANLMVTGSAGRYDLAFDAKAGDSPLQTGLTAPQILTQFGAA